MKFDIIEIPTDGRDMQIQLNEAPRAGNILATQLDSLDYAPAGFGVDVRYFVFSENKFQAESFKGYLVERLLQHQVNVVSVLDTLQTFSRNLVFSVGSSEELGT